MDESSTNSNGQDGNLQRRVQDLLDRPAPEGYLEEWVDAVASAKDKGEAKETTVLVFRLGSEWLAMSNEVVKEILQTRLIHHIPHRSNKVLKGLANVRGELQLCFSLQALLGIEDEDESATRLSRRIYRRLAVAEKEGHRWGFPVDEVFGIHQLAEEEIEEPPVNIAASSAPFTRGVFRFRDEPVGLLDEELVFYKLKKEYL